MIAVGMLDFRGSGFPRPLDGVDDIARSSFQDIQS